MTPLSNGEGRPLRLIAAYCFLACDFRQVTDYSIRRPPVGVLPTAYCLLLTAYCLLHFDRDPYVALTVTRGYNLASLVETGGLT